MQGPAVGPCIARELPLRADQCDSYGRRWGWRSSALVVVVCVAFWPANLGGRTTFVTTHGISMLPRFHAGDLAIVQPASKYRVGDIAAYRSDTINSVVLHRIIAVDGSRLTFKGDNNDFVDPDHPTADQVIGRLRVQIPHGGSFHSVITQPVVLFPFLVLVFGAVFLLPGPGPPQAKERCPGARRPRPRVRRHLRAPRRRARDRWDGARGRGRVAHAAHGSGDPAAALQAEGDDRLLRIGTQGGRVSRRPAAHG